MGGLIPSWNNYYDEFNSISRPIQMGPLWLHAQDITGIKMASGIWATDPPLSSYPACIAVKSVSLQSEELGFSYLELLREALMLRGENIGQHSVLMETAERLYIKCPDFDINKYNEDLLNNNALECFRKDLQEVQLRCIGRFPTIIVKNKLGQGYMIIGYRTFENLRDTIKKNNLSP